MRVREVMHKVKGGRRGQGVPSYWRP